MMNAVKKFFQVFVQSFYSAQLYRRAAVEMKGTGLLYLIALTLLVATVASVKPFIQMNGEYTKSLLPVIRTMPPISIINGEASVNASLPYYVKSVKGRELFILDTAGTVTSLDKQKYFILLTKNNLIVRWSSRKSSVYQLAKVKKLSINADSLVKWGRISMIALIIAGFVLITALLLMRRVLFALFCGLIGLVIKSAGGAHHLTYGALLRLSCIAMTPAITVNGILSVMPDKIASGPLFFFLTVLYLAFAIKSNKAKETNNAGDQNQPTGESGSAIDRTLSYRELAKLFFNILIKSMPHAGPVFGIFLIFQFIMFKLTFPLMSPGGWNPALLFASSMFGLVINSIFTFYLLQFAIDIRSGRKPAFLSASKIFAHNWMTYMPVACLLNIFTPFILLAPRLSGILQIASMILFMFAPMVAIYEFNPSIAGCFKRGYDIAKGYRWDIFFLFVVFFLMMQLVLMSPMYFLESFESQSVLIAILSPVLLIINIVGTAALYFQIISIKDLPLPADADRRKILTHNTNGRLVVSGIAALIIGISSFWVMYVYNGIGIRNFENRGIREIVLPDNSKLTAERYLSIRRHKKNPHAYRVSFAFSSCRKDAYICAIPKAEITDGSRMVNDLMAGQLVEQNKIIRSLVKDAEQKRSMEVDINGRKWTKASYAAKYKMPAETFGYTIFFTDRDEYYIAAAHLDTCRKADDQELKMMEDALQSVVQKIQMQ